MCRTVADRYISPVMVVTYMSDPRSWNPWHGCRKYSEGCENCYVFFTDGLRGVEIPSTTVRRTGDFYYPVKRDRNGNYKVPAGSELDVNRTSDSFIEEASEWLEEVWDMVRERSDVIFSFLTKRVARMAGSLPPDWGDGYDNVSLNITCENQRAFDERWPIFRDIPAKHKGLNLAPLIGPIDLSPALESGQIEYVRTCGEFFGGDRPCRLEWLESISGQCSEYEVNLAIGPVGAVFYRNGFPYVLRTTDEMLDYAYRTHLSRFFRRVDYDLYDPIDGHLLNGSEIKEPMYNANRCVRCTQMELCRGCVECGNCGKVDLITGDELTELRNSQS